MPSIYTIMDISRWALQASSAQLNVVSHNVANVNTDGYSRQEAIQTTRIPEDTPQGYYGRGTALNSVVQKVDKLILERISDKTSSQSYCETRLSQLSRLEALSNEAGEQGIGGLITSFFNAWQEVANDPDTSAIRQNLKDTAESLADRLNGLMEDLTSIEKDLDTYIAGAVQEANTACRRIAELNDQIIQAEALGQTANDLRDERMRQINDLAGIIDINWFEDGNGSIQIQTGTGKTLVQNAYPANEDADPLVFGPVEGYGDAQLSWNGLVMDSNEVTGGNIGAWLQVRQEDIPEMKAFMNDLSNTLIWEVNSLHSQGSSLDLFTSVTGTYTVNDTAISFNSASNTDLAYADKITAGSFELWVYEAGTRSSHTIQVAASDTMQDIVNKINAVEPGMASITTDRNLQLTGGTGQTFGFANDSSNLLAAVGINTFFNGSSATSIALNSTISSDVRNIAAGRLAEDGEHAEGDNSNALDMADLKDADTMTGQTETFNESIISWSAELGTQVSTIYSSLEFAEVALDELKTQRDSVSGVSLDEELVKMIQYQRSYQMSAKLISTADALLAALMEAKR
jgi:flagellar hook-associated protein 1 FlgK